MAKTKSGSARPVAIELLEADHRNVEALLEQYESEKESDDGVKRAIAMQICAELTAHAQLEEELFYPWLRENLDEEDMEMLEEAYVEHASVKDLIAQIEGASDIGPEYDAKVKVLGEYVKHHVQEEENEIFKEVRDMQDELDELGQEMHARKSELMEELGLTQGEEDLDDSEETEGDGMRRHSGSRHGEQRGAR